MTSELNWHRALKMKYLSLVVEALKDIYCYVMLDELEEPCSVYIYVYINIYIHI